MPNALRLSYKSLAKAIPYALREIFLLSSNGL